MASSFATSTLFQSLHVATNINREYLMGATSGGYAYPNGTSAADTPQLQTKTISRSQNAGITWKIYVNPVGTGCSGPPYECLVPDEEQLSLELYLRADCGEPVSAEYSAISQYLADVQKARCAVAEIDRSDAG